MAWVFLCPKQIKGGIENGSKRRNYVLHKDSTVARTGDKGTGGSEMCIRDRTSSAALSLAGLDWRVIQKPVLTEDGLFISGFKANVRDRDNQVLGVVSDRYKVVQNEDAFAFTDELLGEGVTYETAGSLQNGRRTWILAKLPQRYIISGDEIDPYLVFMNSHDGTGAIKAAMTPIRVVCQNTLNLALSTARRSWSTIHTGDIHGKLQDARNTLLYADRYMAALGKTIEELSRQKLSDRQVLEYIDALFPLPEDASEARKKNLGKLKEDLKLRYFDAPDLQHVGKNAYRFVNAVSDFATHARPLRERSSYRESLFGRTVDGNVLIDRAFGLVKAA